MRFVRIALILAVAAVPFGNAPGAGARASLGVDLSGAAEVPAGSGDADGAGVGSIVLKTRTKRLCWEITFSNIDAPNKGHIHRGPVDQDGPVFFTLFDNGSTVSSPATGCSKAKRSLLKEIQADPGGFYVNLHNAAFPDGAIRGQLHT
jgi:hypothetical protein